MSGRQVIISESNTSLSSRFAQLKAETPRKTSSTPKRVSKGGTPKRGGRRVDSFVNSGKPKGLGKSPERRRSTGRGGTSTPRGRGGRPARGGRGTARGRGRGGGRGAGRGKSGAPKKRRLTKENLDAELDAYMGQSKKSKKEALDKELEEYMKKSSETKEVAANANDSAEQNGKKTEGKGQ